MRVGSVVFATDQGLGYLAKSFYDNGIINDVIVLNHGRRPTHMEWYPNSRLLHRPDIYEMRLLASSCDVMLFFETPFNWDIFNVCKSIGVKTALIPMYECMPKDLPAKPDLIINPSLLDQQYYPQGKFIPIPVDRPWRLRERAKVFVHNAGNGGLNGRNGTLELVQAIPKVVSRVEFIIRCQDSNLAKEIYSELRDDNRVRVITGTQDYDTLYDEGDVFVFPEKFNGLSLPLQEAYASGMLVMATDRFPMHTWLPKPALIPTSGWTSSEVSPRCNRFDESIISPTVIAAKIDEWAGKWIGDFSLMGRNWASVHSWEMLKPIYIKELENLL